MLFRSFFDGHYVLVTLKEMEHPAARSFRVQDNSVQEEQIEEVAG